jgi:hypothetical protein
MELDRMAIKFAVVYMSGCMNILRKSGIPENEIKEFGESNLGDLIEYYKKYLQEEAGKYE